MKEIILTQGKTTFVDDEDYEYLNKSKWYCRRSGHTFYASRNGRTHDRTRDSQIQMHRVITNCPKNMIIDHIDGNGLNNQRHNIRITDKRGNAHNVHNIKKTSRFIGVYFNKKSKKYYSQLWIDGTNRFLIQSKDEVLAATVYNNYYKIVEYAKTNCIKGCCCD